jgi:hypothetical protein
LPFKVSYEFTLVDLSGFAVFAPRASTLFLQHKRVTSKGRPTLFAPRKAFGVPEFSAAANAPVLMRHPGAQD